MFTCLQYTGSSRLVDVEYKYFLRFNFACGRTTFVSTSNAENLAGKRACVPITK